MQFVKRKWGWWVCLWQGKGVKLKLLYVKKNHHLSMQRHQYRNELWLFLFGSGFIANLATQLQYRDKSYSKGDYKLISKNTWHQYHANKRTMILEVQYGDKCEETDIERLND